jgi:ATP-dependent Clp protease ATP-binding subunit ClpC
VRRIVDLQIQEIQERLGERGLRVELSSAARDWLGNEGYDPAFGARPLRRALQKYVESPLSISLLGGQFSEGSTILVDVDAETNKLVFRREDDPAQAEKLGAMERQEV